MRCDPRVRTRRTTQPDPPRHTDHADHADLAHHAHHARRHRPARALVVIGTIFLAALATTAAAPGWLPYRVHGGDSLWGLARSHHTTVAAIRATNGLTGDRILAGQLLSLPGAGTPTTATATPAGAYRVRAGDTLSAIARRYGTGLAALARANGLTPPYRIVVDRTLRIPGATTTAAVIPSVPYASAGTRAAARDLVRAEALRSGVDPALALAVATVESGYNQRAVSSTGAVGVMQLMPQTSSWLSGYVGRPLDRYSTADNITGGVTFLRILLSRADTRTAVAAYYQGLGSVRAHGMFRDTRRYVAAVLAERARLG